MFLKKQETAINTSKSHKATAGSSSDKAAAGVLFSFFAGAGFLDLGFEDNGFEVAFVNEIHKPFLDAYKYSRQQMGSAHVPYYHHADMAQLIKGKGRKLLAGLVSDARNNGVVGFIGGPPCPDFSVGGKNLGRSGKHGILSAIYTKIVIQQQPDFFLFENVKGLWKTKSHREYYEELKKKLQRSGYVTTEKLINSLEYGVAQDRDRIILVGFLKSFLLRNGIETGRENELQEGLFPWSHAIKYSKQVLVDAHKKAFSPKHGKAANVNRRPTLIPKDTTVSYWFAKNKVGTHPNAIHYFKPKEALGKFTTIKEGDVSKKSFKRLHRFRYSPTAAYGNNEVHLHPVKPRRISVAEALAIQSLPGNFTFPATMTLSDMFKAVGNGVPYVAASAVAGTIKKFLNNL